MKIGTLVVSITTYEPDPEEWIGCKIRRVIYHEMCVLWRQGREENGDVQL